MQQFDKNRNRSLLNLRMDAGSCRAYNKDRKNEAAQDPKG